MNVLRLIRYWGMITTLLLLLTACNEQGTALPTTTSAGLNDRVGQPAPTPLPDPALLTDLYTELERQLAAVGQRSVSAPPSGAEAAAVLSFDTETSILHWGYYSPGDYDQNGEVNAADLTPIALHFGAAGQFAPDSIQAVIDGDGNGEINAADISPIAVNYGNSVVKYIVYTSLDIEDYPADGGINGPGAQLLGQVETGQGIAETGRRLQFSFAVSDPLSDAFYWVRPSDGSTEGTPSRFGAGENQWPIAVLSADPANGLAPLSVRFNGYSSGDLDGLVVNYEWDFDGPGELYGWEDTDRRGWVEHVYTIPGDYIAQLRVTDNNGAQDTDEVLIRVRELEYPEAVLSVTPDSGSVPLQVTIDASLSSDRDGLIVSYEWDFDNDGVYDYNSGTDPVTDFYYYEPRRYFTTLRVTDNDGLSATTSLSVDAAPGAEWHVTTAIDVSQEPEIEYIWTNTLVMDASTRPAMFFTLSGPSIVGLGLAYIRAGDSLGTTWGAVRILESSSIKAGSAINVYPLEIQNRPAAMYRRLIPEPPEILNFIRISQDASGSVWNQPWIFSPWPNSPPALLADGSVGYFTESAREFYRSDSSGLEWASPVDVIPVLSKGVVSMTVVDGNPAIAFAGGNALYFLRASNQRGGLWPTTPTLILSDGIELDFEWLTVLDGYPAIAYYDGLFNSLRFVRALDERGEKWGEPVRVTNWMDSANDSGLLGTIFDGRIALLYRDKLTGGLRFIVANDVEGRSWGLPMVVSSGPEDDGSSFSFPDNLASVNGNPAFCREFDAEGNYDNNRLSYCSYY